MVCVWKNGGIRDLDRERDREGDAYHDPICR